MSFVTFVLLYSMTKTMRVMLAATAFLIPAWGVSRWGGYRTQRLNLALLSIVPLACLMDRSKVFYTSGVYRLTEWIDRVMTKEMAMGYFAVAGILFLRFCRMHLYMGHRLKAMRLVYDGPITGMGRGIGRNVRIYVSADRQGPLAGGVFRPYIVLPQALLDGRFSKEEWEAVCCHEAFHIHKGHIVLLNLYALLKILWWAHPLVYLCDKMLRENIEYSSDEGSVMYGRLDAYAYGTVIVKALQLADPPNFVWEGVKTFSGDSFAVMKKRLLHLGAVRKDAEAFRDFSRKKRTLYLGTAAVLAIGCLVVHKTSFPKYTQINEISVFDDDMSVLTYDLAAEGIAAEGSEDSFYISREEFGKLVDRYQPKGSYVLFAYGSVMKVPGVGGMGQCALVRLDDPTEVSLLAKPGIKDKLFIFIIKYVI